MTIPYSKNILGRAIILSFVLVLFVSLDSTSADSRTGTHIKHEILLERTPGLPSTLILKEKLKKDSQARALLVLDGKLLTVPFYNKSKNTILFPTPEKSLTYRFQIIGKGGKAFISDEYSTDVFCEDVSYNRALKENNKSAEQIEALNTARELEKNIHLLTYLTKSVEALSR